MVRWTPEERRERLVHSTLRAGWARFGAAELDEATYEYITGIACSVMAEARDGDAGEQELLEQLGPILQAQDLKDKQVLSLCRAMARCIFPQQREGAPAQPSAEPKAKARAAQRSEALLCRVKNLILMYMGGTKLLLKDTTFELRRGHCYGVVGVNGAGKTTLMERIAAGAVAELAESGLRFVHIRHETLGERADLAQPAVDFCRQLVGPMAPLHESLDEVGFSDELRVRPVRELSGGWRVRLLLATAVAQRADALLLDEPTNHLDTAAVNWLVDYLTKDRRSSTSLIVSHDAAFLDRVCTDIIHFDECQLKYYSGNFARFQEQAMLHEDDEVKAVLQVRGSEAYEPKPKARSVAPSKAEESSFRMSFPLPGKVEGLSSMKKPVIELKDASFRYPAARDLALRRVSSKVTLSSRIAIVGPNGAGKSTLLSLLCGEIRPVPDERGHLGEVNRLRSLRLSYIAQNHMFHLGEYGQCTPMEYVQLRFRHGYDEELQRRLNSPASPEEEQTLNCLAAKYGKYGKRVEAVLSRSKRKSEWRYEVQWEGLNERQNTFESVAKLRQLGVERMATALDERLAALAVGNDQRPLTRREIVRHFEGFGLSEDLVAMRSIGTFSGGQKSKLMIGAAFWMKPHLVCMDEPTNFLDFETVSSLARALRQFRGGFAVVSHNEDFLASVCNEIWSVEDRQLTVVRADSVPDEELATAEPEGLE